MECTLNKEQLQKQKLTQEQDQEQAQEKQHPQMALSKITRPGAA